MNTSSAKEPSSLQFNGINWKSFRLGENVLLLEAPEDISIDKIHHSAALIERFLGSSLADIVLAYHTIALFSDMETDTLFKTLLSQRKTHDYAAPKKVKMAIPICYEKGPDLETIASYAKLSVEKVIDIHLRGTYCCAFTGFTPGFIYAEGLDKRIACPRRANPRTAISAGSVGIGGHQTGIYSMNSPGGWNIIGQTPIVIFSHQRQPPMLVEAGTIFTFHRITREVFESWEN